MFGHIRSVGFIARGLSSMICHTFTDQIGAILGIVHSSQAWSQKLPKHHTHRYLYMTAIVLRIDGAVSFLLPVFSLFSNNNHASPSSITRDKGKVNTLARASIAIRPSRQFGLVSVSFGLTILLKHSFKTDVNAQHGSRQPICVRFRHPGKRSR